ncbi:MAG: undecaprenyldiphospho-muramoylpentapeptide beta-N-acetylglucosaminyltransferase [Succinimonas sp.]|jgi:UDP-N-acetylglucosamine--N-acetylmuramyl-(pentapeptide) pyrophosphoryl-undecaprenol N-acetylglucosamine transferase|nr:undecaprenyldiphospho-muramoylpentapeptide beta-N-acetylglucosaminyltransferase [Succinimonas sp.]
MKKILIMAGGTGGHVFPGLAVADELSKGEDPWEVLWLGTRERMEADLVPRHGYPIEFIKVQGIRRNGFMRKLLSPFMILRAVAEAFSLIRKFRPDVVLGMGGYASGPGGLAARLLGIPLVLHEQNAAPGMTNRMLSHIASKVLLGFPGAINKKGAEFVGNPVRKAIKDLHDELPKDFSGEKLQVLVVGGSLGAQALNERVPGAVKKALDAGAKIEIFHQTGKGNSAGVRDLYASLGVPETVYQVSDFIDDMAAAYRSHHLIVCRAGALTAAEIGASGMPAIFVPLPTAVDDHQTKNARSFSDNGAGITMPQPELTEESLSKYFLDFAEHREKLAAISEKAQSQTRLDAAAEIAAICRSSAK